MQDTVLIVLKSPDHEILPFAYHLHDTMFKLFQCVPALKVIYALCWCRTEAFRDLRSHQISS